MNRDYCATCGHALAVLPSGSRVACHPDEAQYWSPHEPSREDRRRFYQMTGLVVRSQSEFFIEGMRREHAPLFLYRSISGGQT